MISQSPILASKKAWLYSSVFEAAHSLILEVRMWRNAIESEGTSIDFGDAQRKLQFRVQRMEHQLSPLSNDGIVIDPFGNLESSENADVRQRQMGRQLAQARNGTYSAFGFSGQSAHEVVLLAGEATLNAIGIIGNAKDEEARRFLCEAQSPLRIDCRRLGPISASEADRVRADCLWEAEKAFARARSKLPRRIPRPPDSVGTSDQSTSAPADPETQVDGTRKESATALRQNARLPSAASEAAQPANIEPVRKKSGGRPPEWDNLLKTDGKYPDEDDAGTIGKYRRDYHVELDEKNVKRTSKGLPKYTDKDLIRKLRQARKDAKKPRRKQKHKTAGGK